MSTPSPGVFPSNYGSVVICNILEIDQNINLTPWIYHICLTNGWQMCHFCSSHDNESRLYTTVVSLIETENTHVVALLFNFIQFHIKIQSSKLKRWSQLFQYTWIKFMCSFPILLHFKDVENFLNLSQPARLFPKISTAKEALKSCTNNQD